MIDIEFVGDDLALYVSDQDRPSVIRMFDLIVEHTLFNKLALNRSHIGPNLHELSLPPPLLRIMIQSNLATIDAHHHFIGDNFVSDNRITLTWKGERFVEWLRTAKDDDVFLITGALVA